MGPQADRWMQRLLPLLQEAAAGNPVLELGCDTGGDTAWLVAQGLPVVAADIALPALQACARAVPAARLLQLDLRQPLPFADGAFGVVVASLSLHYFDWATTERAVAEVRRCLRPGGLLLCRLNSTRDVLHGASGHAEIEPNYYRVSARYAETKRFFDAADLERLFAAGWQRFAMEERRVLRYAEPKVAWELVLRRASARTAPYTAAMSSIHDLRRILATCKTLAVVGLSPQWHRPSFFAAKYMQAHGYRIVPVNPMASEILGERCYPSITAAAQTLAGEGQKIDLVDCFRKSEDIPPIADEAIAIGAKCLWLQIGVVDEASAAKARAAGLDVVMDRCVKIEHARLFGGLNWAGVNTRVISARRPQQLFY